MSYAATSRRLATAVALTLAVTLGTGVLSGTAPLGPVTGSPAMVPAGNEVNPSIDEVVVAGATGFVSSRGGGFATDYRGIYRWVPYDGGATKEIRGVNLVYHTVLPGDLIVVETEDRSVLRDAVSGKDLQSVPLGRYAGAVGSSLFDSGPTVQDVITLEMLVGQGDAVTRRPVTGLPADVRDAHVSPGNAPGRAVIAYYTGPSDARKHYTGVLDLATGAVTESSPAAPGGGTSASSPERTALHRTNTDRITVTDRSTGATRDIVLPKPVEDLELAFVGDWLLYVRRGGLHATEPSPYHALTAYDLTKGGTRKLLDHVTSLAPGADGAPLVRGGSLITGEGYYRLAPGAGGVPAATLRSKLPERAAVGLVSSPPTTFDLTRATRAPVLYWSFTRDNVEATVTLRHTATGRTTTFVERPDPSYEYRDISYDWQRDLPAGPPANGAYTWKLSVRPLNGIGPVLNTSGAFTVVRKANAHDFNDNGTPDVLTRDAQGRLWRHDTFFRRDPVTWKETWTFAPRVLVGTGWQAYDRIEATGNLGGSGVGDVVGRDKAGVLWLHKGRGDGTFAARIRVGTGWGAYNQLAGGSDVTGDGRPDLLGIDKAGVLWIHPGTGKDTAPFAAARTKVSAGWGAYNDITAVGNLAGNPTGDLLARDRNGTVWQFLGTGKSGFAPRSDIGRFSNDRRLVGVGDADLDGHADLLSYGVYNDVHLRRGTGDWRSPLNRTPDGTLSLSAGDVPYDSVA
ncbi:VCBS repeat-containing protein [Streptomyces sp. NPDC007872]|uniref:VCBS repeat-containing protein n=1 Tax=Streptomyces sp. NPDC007872 TaxID=3364782 RepID=UPI0036B26C4D